MVYQLFVFLILAAIRSAKRKNRTFSISTYCDIAKAYDSVCRKFLYANLSNIGFGGRVVSLIRSMYYNDCVRISLVHGHTDLLYFTRGVKQGCSLSTMLFALYISGLGDALHLSKLGIISTLFFADDLVLISSTPKTGMNMLQGIVAKFCRDMRMASKTFILFNALNEVSWSYELETIEETLVAKYLGVDI